MDRIWRATINSWNGLIAVTRSETRDHDPAIKRIKDMGSAAVGLSLLATGAVWIWIAVERLWP